MGLQVDLKLQIPNVKLQINDKSQIQKMFDFIKKYQQVLVIKYCNLRFICYLDFIICKFADFNFEISIYI
jgi:hypothetical protein